MYRFSQDHLEMFFSVIRSRLGCNNNPSSFELMHMLKSVLSVKLCPTLKGNCLAQDEIDMCISPLGTLKGLLDEFSGDLLSDSVDTDIQLPEDIPAFQCNDELDGNLNQPFINNIVSYVAGFVCTKLCSSWKCASCISILFPGSNEEHGSEYLLLDAKNNGGLFIPSTAVVNVCKIAEGYIRSKGS